MNPFVIFYNLALQVLSPLFRFVVTRWRRRVYLAAAGLFSVFIVADATHLGIIDRMQHAGFDLMLRYRLFTPKPDPGIVIVDIDEASLASLAAEYGRWPWPRIVLGEFLEHLERQKPRAVVFDILFSDPDVFNPDSDDYFDAAVAATGNTFFPMLRLDPASDPLSEIRVERLPGASPVPGKAQAEATIAVVVPSFRAILESGRVGFHNIYPDGDGVVRSYDVYREEYGWRIPSLPARVVRELGYPEPAGRSVLLNWRGGPSTYPAVGFATLFNDMLSRNRTRPQDEFSGKIVLIGSTAPSLFDVKPTPVSRLHPGVEIMATAIDNMKRGDYLQGPEGRMLYPALALLMVWVIAFAFFRDTGPAFVNRLTSTSEFALLAVSYASINFGHTYINLTGPFTVGLAYFAVARAYAAALRRTLERSTLRTCVESEGRLKAFLLLVRVAGYGDGADAGVLRRVVRKLKDTGTGSKSIEALAGTQNGLWTLLDGVIAVSWAAPVQDAAARALVAQDVERAVAVLDGLPPQLRGGERALRWVVHEGDVPGGEAARAAWDRILAEAQLKLHEPQTLPERGAD